MDFALFRTCLVGQRIFLKFIVHCKSISSYKTHFSIESTTVKLYQFIQINTILMGTGNDANGWVSVPKIVSVLRKAAGQNTATKGERTATGHRCLFLP